MKKFCYFAKKKIKDKHANDKKYCKVRDHSHYAGRYRGVKHSICNLKYIVYLKQLL